MRTVALAILVVAALGCNGTTGAQLVTFNARAGGVSGATSTFTSSNGYQITLKEARFDLGAIYLNLSVPSSGGPEEPCVLPGIYVGEAFGPCQASGGCGVEIDLLSSQLVTISTKGEGIASTAREGEVWLTSGDVNATDDPTPIIRVAGTAHKGEMDYPFSGTVTIGANRAIPPSNPAMPGANPICRRRIVSPIPVDFTLGNGGNVDLRVDVRGMFDQVDFAAITPDPTGTYVIPDESGGVGGVFFSDVTSTSSYTFAYSK